MRFPKPRISIYPVGEVTWGQTVEITCSVSTQVLGGSFTLSQIQGSFRRSQTSNTNSATFKIPNVDFDNEGSYQCQYKKRGSSREFSSPLSDSVRLSVTSKKNKNKYGVTLGTKRDKSDMNKRVLHFYHRSFDFFKKTL